jgi:hypothetical protein
MRQSVMAHGDEGLIRRVLTLQFRLALLSLLDTLIDLLAAFRAGKFAPLPTVDEPSTPRPHRPVGGPSTIAARNQAPPRRARHTTDPAEPPADASAAALPGDPEQSAAGQADPPPRRAATPLPPPRMAMLRPEPGPRGVASHPSHVPRWPVFEIGLGTPRSARAYFVPISFRSASNCRAMISFCTSDAPS